MERYSISIQARDGSDSFDLKKNQFKHFDIFGKCGEIRSDLPDTFPLSIITFNEDIEDSHCMAIAGNITKLIGLELDIENDSEEIQEKIKNLVSEGPYRNYPFVVSETTRTYIALSEMKYNNKPVMDALFNIAISIEGGRTHLMETILKCKIRHCN